MAAERIDAYAVVIGIGDYQDDAIPKLRYTRNDAQALYDMLVDPGHLNLPRENVRLLLDQDATKRAITKTIGQWLFRNAGRESTVVVFFAGHGGLESDRTNTETDGKAKYLLPWDAEVDDLFSTGIANNHFNHLLSAIQAERLVVFLDACYAAGVTRPGARDIGLVDNPYEKLLQGKGRMVIASAQPNQRSWEDSDWAHGIFSYHLLEAMNGAADNDDDGYVSVLDIFDYLRRKVPESARRRANSPQTPLLIGEAAGEIILGINPDRIELRAREEEQRHKQHQAELKQWRERLFLLHQNGKLPLAAFQDALALLEKESDMLSADEQRLRRYLDLLLEDKIEVELYLTTTAAFRDHPLHANGRDIRPTPDPVPAQSTLADRQFCTECGAKLVPGHRFCTGCGRPIE